MPSFHWKLHVLKTCLYIVNLNVNSTLLQHGIAISSTHFLLCYRLYGWLNTKVSLPQRPSTWLIEAVTMSRENGLAFSQHPARVQVLFLFVCLFFGGGGSCVCACVSLCILHQ